jgi:alanine racemase
MKRHGRTWLEVDLAAVRDNARTVASRAAGARLLPMVKANGYGLGAVRVAQALEPLDPWGYGVATAREGTELRGAGIRRRILVFAPLAADFEVLAMHDLTPALGSAGQVRAWRSLAAGRPFHLQVDTGMGRAGIWWEEFAATAAELSDMPGLEGVFTHFHSAESDAPSVKSQWERFQAALAALVVKPALVHAANSAAALGHPETRADLVRPGVFLYGGRAADATPRPVITWRARVLEAGWRTDGVTVSYGATFRVRGRMSLITLAAGYADGLRRDLSNRGEVLVAGRRLGIAGRVTMDMTVVWSNDVVADEGAVATIIGSEGGEAITLDDHAAMADTIAHEILTGIGPRVERVYAGE